MSDTLSENTSRDAIEALREKIEKADEDTLRLLLTEARTHYAWQDRTVPDTMLRHVYDLAKMGPTSQNQQPMRLIFVRSSKMKKRLLGAVADGNKRKVEAAPITAIVAYDCDFFKNLPQLFPHAPQAAKSFEDNPEKAQASAFRNATLQGAWLIIAARAAGLDTGPMSGFDPEMVKELFFPEKPWKANFLCNLGYGDASVLRRKLPRMRFEDVAAIV